MSRWQRIKSVAVGLFMLLVAVVMILSPDECDDFITSILALSLLYYGGRLLVYYLTMARHMVGGKLTLYQAVIVLDAGLFTVTLIGANPYVIMVYLLGVYAFSGVIDILRAFEQKKQSASWKLKFSTGLFGVIFAVVLAVFGIAFKEKNILIYGYSISLMYSAVFRIITAFRRSAIVYIQ